MLELIEGIVIFLFRIIFAVLFAWTGEIVLFLVTFGKHKPRWELYASQSPSRFVLFSEISLWIGMAFWVFIIAVSYMLTKE